jgi:hypothetical protein
MTPTLALPEAMFIQRFLNRLLKTAEIGLNTEKISCQMPV